MASITILLRSSSGCGKASGDRHGTASRITSPKPEAPAIDMLCAFDPSSVIRLCRDSGPRELLTATSCPASTNKRAAVAPIFPAPRIPIFICFPCKLLIGWNPLFLQCFSVCVSIHLPQQSGMLPDYELHVCRSSVSAMQRQLAGSLSFSIFRIGLMKITQVFISVGKLIVKWSLGRFGAFLQRLPGEEQLLFKILGCFVILILIGQFCR